MRPSLISRLFKAVSDFVHFVRFIRAPGGLGRWSDDLNVPDAYGPDGRGRTRVFISYERHSHSLALKLAHALRAQGLAAFTYTPASASDRRVVDKSQYSKLQQVEHFEATSPQSVQELEATLLHTHLFVFLVSEYSLKSGVCSVEGFASFFSGARTQGKAVAVAVKEQADLEVQDFMWNLPTYLYEPGVEVSLAQRLALLVQSAPTRTSV